MNKYASLCVLSYKRPATLKRCIKSILATADYPYQLIINSDGGDNENLPTLWELYNSGKVSNMILNTGKNRGVGRSFQNCLGVAEGDYIFKIDTDLVFKPHWLSTACNALEKHNDIGAVSLFNYRHYDPNDTRFNVLEERVNDGLLIVNDFVSSVYGFRKHSLDKWGREYDTIPDDGYHTLLGKRFGHLAITSEDYCTNDGFGVGKSVYVSGTMDHPYKTPTFDQPIIFK